MKKNYLTGILGALLGGLIATIPWVLLYVYTNIMWSFLAIFIAIGALKGYELFKGKTDKKLPIIITIVSIISISLATLVIIPPLLLLKDSVSISITNLRLLYTDNIFIAALIKDYIITIIFTLLGISSVISSIKKQTLNNKASDKIKINLGNGNSKKDKEKVKQYFLANNATNEENAISIENNDINMNTINILMSQEIIIKTNDKYYYIEEHEKKLKKRATIIGIITGIIVFILSFLFIILNSGEKEEIDDLYELPEIKDVYFSIPNNYKEYTNEQEENNWYYIPKDDLSGHSGYINVYYFDSEIQYSKEWIEQTKAAFETYENVTEVNSVFEFKNIFDSNVVLYDIAYNSFTWEVYYIFGNKKIAVVEVVDYGIYENLKEDGKDIANSFMWLPEDNQNDNL